MGSCIAKSAAKTVSEEARDGARSKETKFYCIPDRYSTIEQVQQGLRDAGLESSSLILGIDFTASNATSGAKTFGGKCLHSITSGRLNPYQEVIRIVGKTLSPFDDDGLIPTFGFGDSKTKATACFPLDCKPCVGLDGVFARYAEVVPTLTLSGPTCFAPLIREAIAIVKEERAYHILVILCDGQVNNRQATEAAIVEASQYPLSIVCIGVGDGPWDVMESFDDELPQRRFDNFQFVPYSTLMSSFKEGEQRDAAFATACLQEIPDQYKLIKKLDLL